MSFIEAVNTHAETIIKYKDAIKTEAATINALILPFLNNVLGYDTTNPLEVEPQGTSTTGDTKTGSVDFIIYINEKPIIIIEAKHVKSSLGGEPYRQIYDYYSRTEAKYAILTNGVKYLFFTDTDVVHILDKEPFLIFDFSCIESDKVDVLQNFCKSRFNGDDIFNLIVQTNQITAIKDLFKKQLTEPSRDFVAEMIKGIHKGSKPKAVIDKYRPLVIQALHEFINDDSQSGDITIVDIDEKQKETAERATEAVRDMFSEIQHDKVTHWQTKKGITVGYQGCILCKLYFDRDGNLNRVEFMTTDNTYPRKRKRIIDTNQDDDFTAYKDEFAEQLKQIGNWNYS